MIGQHIRIRLRDDASIVDTPARRRLFAATVLRAGADFGMVAFGMADTHGHVATAANAFGDELARRIEIALTLRFRLDAGFTRARVKDFEDQWHMYRTFDYAIDQQRRHKLRRIDPFFEATNLPDLLGLRVLGGYTAEHVARWLPRVQRADLIALLGVQRLEPSDGPLELLAESAAAAACLADLSGKSPRAIEARRAAIVVAGRRLRGQGLAELLGIHRTTITRLRKRAANPDLVQAIRLQLGLRRELMRKSQG